MSRAELPTKPQAGARLGTFAGVFTPSILTILGIILFQRLGYVVGSGGLFRAMAIIAIATMISVVTSISLSAIATNMRVRGGGDYYLISRTLGMHYGGAIGLVLFLAQSVSVAFYAIGFGEAVATMLGYEGDKVVTAAIAAVATVVIGIIAYVGADLATKFQYAVMAALAVALASFYFGGLRSMNLSELSEAMHPPAEGSEHGFWILFAIFFPAVTGFTQGVSMSGDLRDPARSLPRGTFWAVGLSTIVYGSAAILLAACLPLSDLARDYNAMRRVAAWPWLIEVGVIAATLSSAMASFLGAPRILQSLARDNVIPPLNMFAVGSGPSNNPRRAVLLAGAVALATIALGSLNAVAALVGMCFLLSYGLLNYATFFEAHAHSPAFRPTFRLFNSWVSLGGAGLCLFAGAMINPFAAAIAGAMMVALYQYLRRTAPHGAWTDSRYAYHFRRVRDHLNDMREGSDRPRDWRPFVLALCNDPIDRIRLLTFASWIDGESGFTTAVRILTPEEGESRDRLDVAEESLRGQIREAELGTFARIVTASDVADGLASLLQAHGIGPLRANTILMSAHEQFGDPVRAGDAPSPQALAAALGQGCNLMLLEAPEQAWARALAAPEEERRIDVWWKGDDTSRLCLLSAHLVTRSEGWEDATIRVHVVSTQKNNHDDVLSDMKETLAEVRITAEADVVRFEGPQSLVGPSEGATIVFLPLRVRRGKLSGPLGMPLAGVLSLLPVTAMVVAGADISLHTDEEEEAEAATSEAQAAPGASVPPEPPKSA